MCVCVCVYVCVGGRGHTCMVEPGTYMYIDLMDFLTRDTDGAWPQDTWHPVSEGKQISIFCLQ